MKVGLSFAHNPKSPGACMGMVCEYSLSRQWTKRLAMELRDRGIGYFLSNGTSLRHDKVPEINAAGCDLAIEIHFNACGDCGASGSETLYHPGSDLGEMFASIMQDYVCNAMGNKNRGIKEGWYQMDRPGVVDFYGDEDGDEKPDYFLKATNCPALILEPEFIEKYSNSKDLMLTGVRSIADAIEDIFNEPSEETS